MPVDSPDDILQSSRGTPIESLLRYHNLAEPLPPSTGHAHLLVAMCMDHRKELVIPNEFAYVLRSAGGNLRDSEFEVAYAIATIDPGAHADGKAEGAGSSGKSAENGAPGRNGMGEKFHGKICLDEV